MKKFFSAAISLLLLCVLSFNFGCTGIPQQGNAQQQKAASQATQAASIYWTGNGGEGKKITIMPLKASGLAKEQDDLASVVQGVFVQDMSKYSAFGVLDRLNLDKVLAETESIVYAESDDVIQLGKITQSDYIMTGSITRTSAGYALQMQVADSSKGTTIASWSGNSSIADLENFTSIKKASLELLPMLGVILTDRARAELSAAASNKEVASQTALARGIIAQRQGTEIAALSYYFQAAAYDPSLLEAVNRSSILNANITSGNIGSDVRNDIAWRRDWVAKLTETEQFVDNINRTQPMPYTLFYANDIKRGTINYQNETVTLSIETHLHGSGIWTLATEQVLQAVYDGLDATKRKSDWQLASWPQRGVTNLKISERQSQNFSVAFELLNNQNKAIGRATLQSRGSWGMNWSGRPTVNVDADVRRTLDFQNVNANDISDSMTIRVATVNGTDAETAARNGVLQIRASTNAEFARNDSFKFSKGTIQGFANRTTNAGNLVIPDTIWDDPVVWIGNEAFSGAGLTSVTIPSSVTSIDSEAFRNNKLTSVTFGSSVTSIGNRAFEGNRIRVEGGFDVILSDNGRSLTIASYNGSPNVIIPSQIQGTPVTGIEKNAFSDLGITSVTIPGSVRSIGEGAFWNNKLINVIIPDSVISISKAAFQTHYSGGGQMVHRISSITIGANVAVVKNSFGYSYRYFYEGKLNEGADDDSFHDFYNKNGKKAGTYTNKSARSGAGDRWVYKQP